MNSLSSLRTLTEKKDQQIIDMTKDYEYRLKRKEDEVQDLKRKIEEMSAEFAKMLKVTDYQLTQLFFLQLTHS